MFAFPAGNSRVAASEHTKIASEAQSPARFAQTRPASFQHRDTLTSRSLNIIFLERSSLAWERAVTTLTVTTEAFIFLVVHSIVKSVFLELILHCLESLDGVGLAYAHLKRFVDN